MKKLSFNFFFSLILLQLFLPDFLFSQEITPPDSSSYKQAHSDSNRVKLMPGKKQFNRTFPSVSDSLKTSMVKLGKSGLDSAVVYKARKFNSDMVNNRMYLIGDAEIKYKNMTIKAGKITVMWNENTIIAEGLPDTTNGNNFTNRDSLALKNTGLPVFSDGKEEMMGDRMEFNFKTERGRVIRGRTEFQGGYYRGDTVKLMGPKVINVQNGRYTTCDKEEPHFHFHGQKMKIITGDKVIAKPVIFFIGKIPLAILPFALFPAKEDGRQSGIIIPRFGTSPQEGRYLENLGYYWATNDYFDARLTLSFFERTGVLFKTWMNYALRYKFSGSVSGSFTRKNFLNGTRQRRWDLTIRHSQTIDANTSLSVNAKFVSNNNFYKEFSNNRNQRLNRQLVSNATFSKRWSEGKNSLTLNLSQTKDLDTGSDFITLPRVQFNRSQSAIFPFQEDKTGRTRAEPKWYNYIRYDYKGLLVNTVTKDSTNDPEANVVRKAEHDMRFTFTNPKKIFGWLTFNQTITYDEDWFNKTKTFTLDSLTNSVKSSEKKGFAARHLFQYSASASTKLYGTFNTRIGALRALRHVMTPSLSFSYQPDFSSSFWGYFETIKDSSGKVIKRDRFAGSGTRGTPSIEQNSLGFGLNNLFQMKLGEGEHEKKIDLFTLIFSGGYNFAADSLNWRDLSTRFQANPRRNLSVTMGMSHSFYAFDVDANRTVNKLLFNEKGIFNFLRLTRFNFDARWTLSSHPKSPQSQQGGQTASSLIPSTQRLPIEQVNSSPSLTGNVNEDRFVPESPFSAFEIPWRASLAFSFSVSKFNPTRPVRRAYIDLSNVEVQLTKNWRIGYRIRYDIEKGDLVDQRISFYRDLHCWEAQFNWTPTGISKGFYFRINIKAPQLRDIKIEHRGGSTTIFRPF